MSPYDLDENGPKVVEYGVFYFVMMSGKCFSVILIKESVLASGAGDHR